MIRFLLIVLVSCSSMNVRAFSWLDLWYTPDQQGQSLMTKGQFLKAKDGFRRRDWSATAAYKAGDYKRAATLFNELKTEEGYYNQGNALAHLGRYEQALDAYNKALALNPKHEDAAHNRQVVTDLLKQEKESQHNQEQQQKQQQKKNQQKDNQQDDSKNAAEKQEDEDQEDKSQDEGDEGQGGDQGEGDSAQGTEGSSDSQQSQGNQDNSGDANTNQSKGSQSNKGGHQAPRPANKPKPKPLPQNKPKINQQNQKKNQNKKLNHHSAETSTQQHPSEEETKQIAKQQANEQWLRLIPDDPGGLIREQFMRDHLKREQGLYQ